MVALLGSPFSRHGGEPEAFLLQDKCIGDDVGRGEKEVQREGIIRRYQLWVTILMTI